MTCKWKGGKNPKWFVLAVIWKNLWECRKYCKINQVKTLWGSKQRDLFSWLLDELVPFFIMSRSRATFLWARFTSARKWKRLALCSFFSIASCKMQNNPLKTGIRSTLNKLHWGYLKPTRQQQFLLIILLILKRPVGFRMQKSFTKIFLCHRKCFV